MIDLNLNKKLYDPVGAEIKGNMFEMVANMLFSLRNINNPIKINDLALRLYHEKVISIDESDFQMIKNYVKTDELFTVLVKTQVLKAFDESEESAKKQAS